MLNEDNRKQAHDPVVYHMIRTVCYTECNKNIFLRKRE